MGETVLPLFLTEWFKVVAVFGSKQTLPKDRHEKVKDRMLNESVNFLLFHFIR
jgi:hypothetical protein